MGGLRPSVATLRVARAEPRVRIYRICRQQIHKRPHEVGVCVFGVPKGIRTPVAAVKGRSPRPLDDGDVGYQDLSRGGARRDRTADLLHAMQALSQLSYSPTEPRALRAGGEAVKKKSKRSGLA